MKKQIGKVAGIAAVVLSIGASAAQGALTQSASGHGSLDGGRRQFSFSARTNSDGTVAGSATLTNRNFTGPNGNQPFKLIIDISCMKVVGNLAFFGGTVKQTNDPGFNDAVYFSVQDNGEPGGGIDKISRVALFDDNPNTTGNPQLCQGNVENDGYLPLETIEDGNIQVRN